MEIHFGAPHWADAVRQYLMHEEVVAVCSGYQSQHGIDSPQDNARVVLLQQSTRPTQWAEWSERVDAPAWRCAALDSNSSNSSP